jgi:Amt family ammonium transporter
MVQLTGIVAVAIYTAIVTFALLKLVGFVTSGIRVTADQEQVGLDITDHDETGYNM